jgi:hypothetical protein
MEYFAIETMRKLLILRSGLEGRGRQQAKKSMLILCWLSSGVREKQFSFGKLRTLRWPKVLGRDDTARAARTVSLKADD